MAKSDPSDTYERLMAEAKKQFGDKLDTPPKDWQKAYPLMMAAPDLLDACCKLLAAAKCHYHASTTLREYGELAEAAIAKATE